MTFLHGILSCIAVSFSRVKISFLAFFSALFFLLLLFYILAASPQIVAFFNKNVLCFHWPSLLQRQIPTHPKNKKQHNFLCGLWGYWHI